jgi:transposase
MRRTKLLLSLEAKIGEHLDNYLKKEYVEKRLSGTTIGKNLGVNSRNVYYWLKIFNIGTRNRTENYLQPGVVKPNRDELNELYINQRRSTLDIAKKFEVNITTALNWLKKARIPIRKGFESRLSNSFVKLGKSELKDLYMTRRKTAGYIAEMFGVSVPTVIIKLKKFNIPIRNGSENQLPAGFKKPTKEELKNLYTIQRKSTTEISKLLGVSSSSVGKWLDKYKIPIRGSSESQLSPEFKEPTKRELEDLYIVQKLGQLEIAKKFKTSPQLIKRFLEKYGIKIRNLSESMLPNGFIKPKKEQLEREYVSKHKSLRQISNELGVAPATVKKWLVDYGIKVIRTFKIKNTQNSTISLLETILEDKLT